MEKKIDAIRLDISKKGYLQTRLQSILTSLDRSSLTGCFYTKRTQNRICIYLQFNNGIDPDPAFSGSILGKLYLDEAKNLTLKTSPFTKDKNRPWRTEVLFSNVLEFECEFLGPNTSLEKNERTKPINAQCSWRTFWPKTILSTPRIIRLKILQEGEKDPLQYAFLLPVPELITYNEAS